MELQARLHMLGDYPRRKKETICSIAALLCKQNSHEISSSPIICVSSLSLCANAKRKGRGGKREGEDHSLPARNCCHHMLLDAWLLCQPAVAGGKKSCSCRLGWWQRIKGYYIQSEKTKTSPKKTSTTKDA